MSGLSLMGAPALLVPEVLPRCDTRLLILCSPSLTRCSENKASDEHLTLRPGGYTASRARPGIVMTSLGLLRWVLLRMFSTYLLDYVCQRTAE